MMKTKQLYISDRFNEEEARRMFNSEDYTEFGNWKLVYMQRRLGGYDGLMVQTKQGRFKDVLSELIVQNKIELIEQGFVRLFEINTFETDTDKLREMFEKLTPTSYKLLGFELKCYTHKDLETGKDCFDYHVIYEAV